MLDEPLPRRQRERATIALASARNLLEILNDILDFSKLEAGQIRIVTESVAVRPLVAEVMELMAPNAAKTGLALTHRVADAVPPRVETDPARLRQILTNLVSNATKFTETGEVAVRVDYDAATATLAVEVEDTGIGIAPEQQERIFEQFVQADTSLTRRAGGTGLGLAICRQLVEGMGGRMTLRSVPGMGSTFAFTLPAPAVAEGAEPAAAARPVAAADASPMHVLLAEDNPTNQYLLNAYLRAAGHTVEMVANGRRGGGRGVARGLRRRADGRADAGARRPRRHPARSASSRDPPRRCRSSPSPPTPWPATATPASRRG